jgi:hypothetical protein
LALVARQARQLDVPLVPDVEGQDVGDIAIGGGIVSAMEVLLVVDA